MKSDAPSHIAFLSGIEASTTIQVIKEDKGDYQLKTYRDNLAISLMTGEPISGRPLTVAGLSAYETVFDFKKDTTSFRMRLISFEKGDYFYDIVFSTAPGSFDKVDKDFDMVVNSFEVE